jgi:hypothetical protein
MTFSMTSPSAGMLGLLADPPAGSGNDGTGDVGDVLGAHEVGVLRGHAVLLGVDAAP